MADTIDELEGVVDEKTENPRCNDPDWWRKVAYSYKKMDEEINQLKFLRDNILKKYDTLIQSRRQELENFRTFIEIQLQESDFTTKTGGFKINMFPDIGIFSLSKKSVTFEVNDESYWIKKGFSRVIPEKKEIDKKSLNEHLKSLNLTIELNRVIDTDTGEIIPGVVAITKRSFQFKQGD